MEYNKGLLAACLAFTIWGLLPLYWKALSAALPLEILCHRITWSTLVTLLLLLGWRRIGKLTKAMLERRTVLRFLASSLFLSSNWLLYIWAVNNDFIVESSLGYYINPLVNVLLGVLFLRERMRPVQWLAILLAATGVCYLTFVYGRFPWIAMSLAISFGIYGLLRKTAALASLEGLCLETCILFIPALLTLFWLGHKGELAFGRETVGTTALLAGTGIVTSLPLILFGYAAHQLPLSTVGVIQYLAPTLQLSLGIFLYSEPFPRERLVGFALVWTALVLYGMEGGFQRLRRKKVRLSR